MGKHGRGQGGNDGEGLDMMVPKHFIGVPMAKQVDAVSINIGRVQCHGATGFHRDDGQWHL